MNTKEQFMQTTADTLVRFKYYYKYVFTFEGEDTFGNTVTVRVGGGADDIYRLDVDTDLINVGDLDPDSGTIRDDEGTVLGDFYDF